MRASPSFADAVREETAKWEDGGVDWLGTATDTMQVGWASSRESSPQSLNPPYPQRRSALAKCSEISVTAPTGSNEEAFGSNQGRPPERNRVQALRQQLQMTAAKQVINGAQASRMKDLDKKKTVTIVCDPPEEKPDERAYDQIGLTHCETTASDDPGERGKEHIHDALDRLQRELQVVHEDSQRTQRALEVITDGLHSLLKATIETKHHQHGKTRDSSWEKGDERYESVPKSLLRHLMSTNALLSKSMCGLRGSATYTAAPISTGDSSFGVTSPTSKISPVAEADIVVATASGAVGCEISRGEKRSDGSSPERAARRCHSLGRPKFPVATGRANRYLSEGSSNESVKSAPSKSVSPSFAEILAEQKRQTKREFFL